MKWEFKDGIPIYQQIVQMLQIGILSGTYPPGSKLPAVRDLALEAGVNPNTMQRALTEMEREGLMYSIRTSGRFVTEDKEHLQELRESLSSSYIEDLLLRLSALGYSEDEILETMKKHLAGKKD